MEGHGFSPIFLESVCLYFMGSILMFDLHLSLEMDHTCSADRVAITLGRHRIILNGKYEYSLLMGL